MYLDLPLTANYPSILTNALGILGTATKSIIITQTLNSLFPSTGWAIEDQAKNSNSTARPYDQRAFSPLYPTASCLSHLALAIYMFVVVSFDGLAQAGHILIERRQVVFLCWTQDSNPGFQTPNRQQTEYPLTNRMSYQGFLNIVMNKNFYILPCNTSSW